MEEQVVNEEVKRMSVFERTRRMTALEQMLQLYALRATTGVSTKSVFLAIWLIAAGAVLIVDTLGYFRLLSIPPTMLEISGSIALGISWVCLLLVYHVLEPAGLPSRALDTALFEYMPIDKEAYSHLQNTVKQEGLLSEQALLVWINAERAAINAHISSNAPWQFVHKKIKEERCY